MSMRIGQVKLERNVPCVLRDGVVLYSDIYCLEGQDNLPVLLMRQPYGKQLASTVVCAHPIWFANHGFMVVIQDVRGRGESEGEFYPFRSEAEDGYDTVEWAARLPRSNGKVGMYGFSYQGITQWAAASKKPPHLTAIAPAMCPVDCYSGMMYPHGSLALAELRTWGYQLARDGALRAGDEGAAAYCTRMMNTADQWLGDLPMLDHDEILETYFPAYYDWVKHPEFDAYWEEFNWLESHTIPALHIGGWYDFILNGTVDGFEHFREKRPIDAKQLDYMVIGPWTHIPWGSYTGDIDHGTESYGDIHQAQLQWFNYWLKGVEFGQLPSATVQYYEVNSREWLQADHMPRTEDNQASYRLYLNSNGTPANGALGGGTLMEQLSETATIPDAFVYDARLPMTTRSYLPIDRKVQQQRYEILVYTSEAAHQSIHLLGTPKLYVKYETISGPTDLVATLSLIHVDGRATMLSIGRTEIHSECVEDANSTSTASIFMRSIGVELQKGMKLRLELTGSAFPLFVRHMNGVRLSEQLSLGHGHLNMATTAIYSNDAACYIEIPTA